jgi:outer membrane protein assembly factor BamB
MAASSNLAAAAAAGPPSHLQSTLAMTNGNLVSSQAASFASPVAAGSLVVVAVTTWHWENTAAVSSVTDSRGNRYVKAVEDPSPPTGTEPLSVWYAANVVGGSALTVTATLTGPGSVSLAIHEYAGAAAVGVLDRAAHASGYGAAGSSGSLATTQSNELLFAAATFYDIARVNASPAAGYTARQQQPDDVCCNALFTADGAAPSAGTYAATYSFAQPVNYRVALVALKSAQPVGPSPTPTSTSTASPTRAPSSPTATATAAPTRTPTSTPVAMPSATPSPTPTTPAATATPTRTPPAAPPPGGGAAEWTQFGHDPQRSGYTAETVPAPWRYRWQWNGADANGKPQTGHVSVADLVQPVTGGGRIYMVAGSSVVALNPTNGQVLWSNGGLGALSATPAYDSGALYVGSGNGQLYRLDASTGTVLASVNAGSGLRLAPLLAGGTVYAVGADGVVHALDKLSLAQRWSYAAGSPGATSPAYSASRNAVVFLSQDLYVHAVDASTGARKWRVKPTPRTYQCQNVGSPCNVVDSSGAQAENGWPVIADQHGLVFVKYRLDWNTLWTWNPFPTTNSAIRSGLTGRPDQQTLFALSLDSGAPAFVARRSPTRFGATARPAPRSRTATGARTRRWARWCSTARPWPATRPATSASSATRTSRPTR